MLEFIKKKSKENIVLFIHGFIGNRDTWLGKRKEYVLIDYLLANNKLCSNHDFALFNYYSKLTDKFEKIKWISGFFKGGRKLKMNFSIEDLADLLYSEIQINLKDYKNIIIIAHSMGGLVAKSCIIKLLETKSINRIKIYFSLAVPHNGSDLANLGKAILANPQVTNLTPLGDFINTINSKWLKLDNLPYTIYCQGKADKIVPKTSSIGYERRKIEPVFSDDDHFSILKPESRDDIIVKSIIDNIFSVENNPKPNLNDFNNKKESNGDNFSNIKNTIIINNSNFNGN